VLLSGTVQPFKVTFLGHPGSRQHHEPVGQRCYAGTDDADAWDNTGIVLRNLIDRGFRITLYHFGVRQEYATLLRVRSAV